MAQQNGINYLMILFEFHIDDHAKGEGEADKAQVISYNESRVSR